MAKNYDVIDEYAGVSDTVYGLFVDYLKNPLFTKIRDDVNQSESYSIYGSKSYCLLSQQCRYVLVFVLSDGQTVGTQKRLSELQWISFQFRTLSENLDLPTTGYEFQAKGPLYEAKINRINVTEKASTYQCDKYPLTVTLLHTDQKKEGDYQKKGSLVSAFVTWETIIVFTV